MDEVERSAASVEEAVESALAELGLTEQQAHIEIVQEPSRGLLGLHSSPAVVRVRAREVARTPQAAMARVDATEDPQLAPQGDEQSGPDEEELEDQADLAADFLEGLLDALELAADVETGIVDGVMYVDVWAPEGSDSVGVLIGRHGHTLDALQELVKATVHHQMDVRCRVVVDVEDYRKRRREMVGRRAQEAARRVLKTGQPERLEPMGAFERKVVHDLVSGMAGLETASEGQEPNRFVVVRPQS